jgi:hypothetical protein
VAVPALAAAGLVGIMLLDLRRSGEPGSVWEAPQRTSVGLDIEAPPGKNVAVFEVEDRPDIVVVWFYDQGD